MSETPQKVTTVNHGDPFNKGNNFYTFYCPECGKQIERQSGPVQKCEHCFTPVKFKYRD